MGALVLKKRTFEIKSENVKCDVDSVEIDKVNWKLHIPSIDPGSSPLPKFSKVTTPINSAKQRLHYYKNIIPKT